MYVVRSDDGLTRYRFAATRYALDHWQVDADSITRDRDGAELPLAALDFFIELKQTLGLSEEILPVYLEEISSTLSGTCYKLTKPQVPVAELAKSDFQAIETGMTEGHPCFVANNGRLGFGIHEYLAYAPETASPVRLVWLAAHRSRAAFTAGVGIEYESFIRAELGAGTVERFGRTLVDRGSIPTTSSSSPSTPGSGGTSSPSPSPPRSPAVTSCASARATTSTSRSSPSGPSSTSPTPRSTM